MKIVKRNQPKIIIFTAVKNCCMLHGHVFVMLTGNQLVRHMNVYVDNGMHKMMIMNRLLFRGKNHLDDRRDKKILESYPFKYKIQTAIGKQTKDEIACTERKS